MSRALSRSSSSIHEKPHGESHHAEILATPELTTADVAADPNWWWKYKQMLREPMAEFAGVMILIIFGVGVDCQVVLSTSPGVAAGHKGEYLSISFGWAIGTAMGVWASAGISGGHINPAVTLALATWRGFPWKKVPGYIFGQLMGGLVGAALVYANYFHALDIFEGGRGVRTLNTAGLFSTYALDYMTPVSCFFSEFLATAVMIIVVLAVTDRGNSPPPNGLLPMTLFLLILGIGVALGMQTGYALNPARDLGPRLLTSMVGYGKAVYTFRNHYWIWCPILGPLLGAQVGTMFYDAFLYNGEDSRFNQPDRATKKRLQSGAGSV
ncbi:major intrinsic protein superfamily membrane channel protein [Lyophyllum atratum]|nr:major intrinsic protein superfamily membrane channel protein [Lyophyllum atratum]